MTFTANPASNGASASLSSTTETIGSNGEVEVTATANSTPGSYTVTATVPGALTPATFDLTNLTPLTFSGLSGPSVAYGTASTTVSGQLADGSRAPNGESLAVTFQGPPQSVTIGPGGAFSVVLDTAGLTASSSPYPVTFSYAGDDVYGSASLISSLTVTPVTPSVTVSDQGGRYSGSAFSATATVAAPGGTPGPSLEGVTPTPAYYQGTYASASLLAGHTAVRCADPGRAIHRPGHLHGQQ